MFRRSSVRYATTPEPVTPYQKAAQVWDERIGSARVQARNWRLMALGCLTLVAGLSTAVIWQSTRSSFQKLTSYSNGVASSGPGLLALRASLGRGTTNPIYSKGVASVIGY